MVFYVISFSLVLTHHLMAIFGSYRESWSKHGQEKGRNSSESAETRRNLVGISCIRNFRYVLFFEITFSKSTIFRDYVFEMYYFSRILIFEIFYVFENSLSR